MNRNQRRAQFAQQKKQLNEVLGRFSHRGPMEFHLIPLTIAFDPSADPQMVEAIVNWMTQVVDGKRQPSCMCCEHRWADTKTDPPQSFAIVMTARDFRPAERQTDTAMVSGICGPCADRPDLIDRCQQFYRTIWPNIKYHQKVHDMPKGMQ